jgi:acyl dehydratase
MTATSPAFESLEVGQTVTESSTHFTRDSLVRYAGASGDFNPIHYRDDIATSVGLPGVLAHGMLTMGASVQPLVAWLADSASIVDYQVRFTRPVLVDAEAGADIQVTTTVGAIEAETRTVRFDLRVAFSGETVLGKAQVRATFA